MKRNTTQLRHAFSKQSFLKYFLIFNLLLFFAFKSIAEKPVACPGTIQLSQVQICVGECLMATYIGNVAPGTTFTWSNACGIISNTNNAGPQTACFTTPGPCTIQVIIQQPGSPPETCTAIAEVSPKPTLTMGPDVTICENGCTNLQIQATGPNPHTFTLSDGTTNTNYTFNGPTFSITVCPTSTTTYSITQAISGPCAPFFPTSTTTVTVAPGINASIFQIGDTLKVLPYWMLYDWYDCNNNSVNNYSYTYVPPASGCYCAILTDPQNGCMEKVCIDYIKPCDLNCSIEFDHNICLGETASFQYVGNAGPGATYNWSIGIPGNPGVHFIGPGPINITYNDTSCYQVVLTVMENGCTVQCVDTICVLPKYWNAQIFQQNGVLLAMPNDSNYTYEWYKCNDSVLISNQANFTPDTAGCYCVILTDINGCKDTSCVEYPLPCKLSCSFVFSDTICVGDSIVITYAGNASSNAIFNWAIDLPGFPGAHFIGAGPIVIPYDVAGCYNITLTVMDSNCIVTCTDSFCVKSRDWEAQIFQEVGVLYAGPNSPGYTYIWHACNDTTILSTQQNFTPPLSGCYCLIVTDKCGCKDTLCLDFPLPCNLTCNINISDYKLCIGDSIVISYTGNASSNATFNWLIDLPGNPGLHFIGSDPKVLTYNTEGCYHVSLTVTDSNCITTCQDSFCVFPAPTADICCDISSCDTCHIITINLTGTAPWYVQVNNGSSIDSLGPILASPYSYQVCSKDTTMYTLTGVTDSNNACDGVVSGSVLINYVPPPVANISIDGDTLCSINSAFAYGWWQCSVGTYFSLAQCVVVSQPGCYCLTLSNNLDCVDSACVIITKTYDPVVSDKLLLYPVPANNEITLKLLDNVSNPDQFEVVDLNGRTIRTINEPTENPDKTYKIDLSILPSGMYFIKVHYDERIIISRFIKH